ncbi:Crp/Fnr family transcriptional regulator [Pseudomonas sp. TTU2014-080ASC]|uniref:Crp/Fnr family transcriptional regulator n=1 Tax=Pseudomonas sp. TTU2014-080ASC TaxID=1729724 RepID=UPI00071882FA|nr:Crp/Fnr family transcriptional regulator [Pseudomonas sp. TTU2014-080ASC]KRW60978.1 Crp/Fnr family transcriptional regulator [Pseudomonas sp. TTU2014-080ASC]
MNDRQRYQARMLQGNWFSSLPGDLQQALLAAAQVQHLDAGQVLFRRGDKPCGLYAVVEGGVRVGAVSSSGKEALLTRVEPPYWFGEISLFDGQPRTHDVFADSATTLLWISQSKLLALLDQEPRYWRDFALLMSQKLRQTFVHLEDMSLLPAPVRLARRLLSIASNYGEGELKQVISLPQEQLALMLAISRQTTNQILRELETQGILRLNYAEIEIVDLQRLQHAAQL